MILYKCIVALYLMPICSGASTKVNLPNIAQLRACLYIKIPASPSEEDSPLCMYCCTTVTLDMDGTSKGVD